MLLTPTTPHQIPVFSKEGIPLHETEFWALIEDRGIFRRDLSMRDEGVPHNMADQDGEMREGGGHDHQVAEVNMGAWAGVSSALQCSDNTGGHITKETGSVEAVEAVEVAVAAAIEVVPVFKAEMVVEKKAVVDPRW
jgi:hypothetical protein